ncbi:MAG: phosphate ABC transporter substrate-binding protein [Acidobacteria bacterium]|nr:phosphate ABC transporter substrate-binding protein [Acidobacteriota bacterium]MCB9399101.1 phosphate ABC transporter substrate-binding protein [Acidobacteriota bacterium]
MKAFFSACLVLGTLTVLAQEPVKVDSLIKEYVKVSGPSGPLNSVGSDTLNNLMTYWSESFQKLYPSVVIEVEGKGSSTAPPALTEGTSQLGPMSRKMKAEEEAKFEKTHGFKPTAIGVALDALAVFVHKDNPIQSLSMEQVDAIFSKTRKGGYAEDITTWAQLGLEGDFGRHPLSLYGRNSASGTYGFFKEHALFKGDYKDQVKEQPGSASVVMGITEDLYGIGYSGIGYLTSGVKTVDLSAKTGEPAFAANMDNVLNKKYPLARMLYIYVAKKPNEPLPVTVQEFIKFVLSKEGQEIVVKDGYMPLPSAVVEKQLAVLK